MSETTAETGTNTNSRTTTKPLAQHNWQRWGADDEKGAANLLDAAGVVGAGGLVRTGRVFSLGINIDAKNVPVSAGRAPPQHFMLTSGSDYCCGLKRRDGYQSTDDAIAMPVHAGTHIDALSHIADEDLLYNGHPLSGVKSNGAKKMGIDKLRSVVGRGVMLDICALRGVNPLPKGYVITAADLEGCEKRQGTKVAPGTILLLHTGWMGAIASLGNNEFLSGEPGIGFEAAHWIAERDVPVVGADNFAVEVIPTENNGAAPIHRMLIRGCGIYFMEMVNLTELAAESVYEFMFVAAPLPITGATGSPINALAIT